VYGGRRTRNEASVKKLAVALLASIAVLAAAPAWAKEIKEVNVCGKSDCTRLSGRKAMGFFDDDGMPTSPPKAAPFYTVEFVATDGKHATRWTVDYLPSAGAIRSVDDSGNDVWTSVNASSAIKKVVAGLQPLPASKLKGAKAASTTAAATTETGSDVGSRPAETTAATRWTLIGLALGACVLVGAVVYGLRRRIRVPTG
jgi:hypothetical protein